MENPIQTVTNTISLGHSSTQAIAQSTPGITLLVIDVSVSMSDDDIKPSRLGAAIEAAKTFALEKRRIEATHFLGVIAFESTAYLVQEPLELGRNIQHITKSLSQLEDRGGTDIACGLEACVPIFFPQVAKACSRKDRFGAGWRKAIVLLTDGHGGSPIRVAKWLKENQVRIECIGVGGDHKDVDETLLKKVASIENGRVLYRFITDRETLIRHFGDIARA